MSSAQTSRPRASRARLASICRWSASPATRTTLLRPGGRLVSSSSSASPHHLADGVTLGRGHDDLVAHGHVHVVGGELVQLAALVEHDPDHSAHYRDTSSNRQNMPRRASAGSTLRSKVLAGGAGHGELTLVDVRRRGDRAGDLGGAVAVPEYLGTTDAHHPEVAQQPADQVQGPQDLAPAGPGRLALGALLGAVAARHLRSRSSGTSASMRTSSACSASSTPCSTPATLRHHQVDEPLPRRAAAAAGRQRRLAAARPGGRRARRRPGARRAPRSRRPGRPAPPPRPPTGAKPCSRCCSQRRRATRAPSR